MNSNFEEINTASDYVPRRECFTMRTLLKTLLVISTLSVVLLLIIILLQLTVQPHEKSAISIDEKNFTLDKPTEKLATIQPKAAATLRGPDFTLPITTTMITATTSSASSSPSSTSSLSVRPTNKKPKFSPQDFRLPETLFPTHYNLRLKIDVDEKTFTGNVTIFFKCVKATNQLSIHAENLNFKPNEAKVFTSASGEATAIGIAKVEHIAILSLYKIDFDQTLTENMNYSITFENFGSNITNNLKGLYLSSYKANGEKRF
jgi:glutamyl aminopeptidase